MKKSKFLKNSKDMLSRSFNPSKCKISLRLAGSRLKLLRNKKEVQLKQMKREIAQLLESGQDQTARIRVEHVIREEKMMAAYDLMQIYCELIVARLPIIESQKICPIDLKEAIATVVFASPRCGDVPELQDVRKHFTEKYGKDFTTAALELRPDCGVSRMVVEKLSAVAPDGQTKTKILSAIAEEHNVKWDPKSFEENSVPASDLLNGPSSFGKEHFESQNVPVPQSNNKVDNSSSESSGINTSVQHEARPPGDEWAHLYQISSNTNGQRWNMEFKDAASAAQAAAESAELASMAARAAARLSSHGRQYSMESRNSDPNVLINEAYTSQEPMNGSISGHSRSRNEETDRMKPNNLKTDGRFNNTGHAGVEKYTSQESMDGSISGHTRSQNEETDRMNPNNLKTDGRFNNTGHTGTKKYTSQESMDGSISGHTRSRNEETDRMKRNNLKTDGRFNNTGHTGTEKYTSQESMDGSISGLTRSRNEETDRMKRNNLKTDGRFNDSGHTGTEKYSESGSLKSKASMDDELSDRGVSDAEGYYSRDSSSNNVSRGGVSTAQRQSFNPQSANVRQEKSENVRGERVRPSHSSISNGVNVFANSGDPEYGAVEDSFSGFGEKGIYEEASQTDSRESAAVFDESDSDSENHTFSYDEPKQGFHLPLLGQKSHDRLSTNTDSWSPRSSTSKTKESPSSLFLNRKSDFSERSTGGSKPDDSMAVKFDESGGSSSATEDDTDRSIHSSISRDSRSKQNQPSGLNSRETDSERHHGKELDTSNSGPESEGGLNLGRLTGGFRQRGFNPPYLKKQSDVSFNKGRGKAMFEHKKSRSAYPQSESYSDSSEEEESLRKSSDHKDIHTEEENSKTKRTIAAPNPIFGSDDSDTDEDLPKQSSGRTSHLRSGMSQRTKAFPSSSGKSKPRLISETLGSDDDVETRPPTKSYSSESQQRFQSVKGNTKTSAMPPMVQESKVNPRNNKTRLISETLYSDDDVETRPPTKSYSSESQQRFQSVKGNTNTSSKPPIVQESKVTHKSSAIQESSRKTEPSISRNKTSAEKDSSNQSASHVHPKLPDYDTLVQSLRTNRS